MVTPNISVCKYISNGWVKGKIICDAGGGSIQSGGNDRRRGEGGIQRLYLGGHHFRVAA